MPIDLKRIAAGLEPDDDGAGAVEPASVAPGVVDIQAIAKGSATPEAGTFSAGFNSPAPGSTPAPAPKGRSARNNPTPDDWAPIVDQTRAEQPERDREAQKILLSEIQSYNGPQENKSALLKEYQNRFGKPPVADRGGFKKASLDDGQPKYGLRLDGTPKGDGYFGPIERTDGDVSTELTVTVDFDGQETEIPTLVPTLSPIEIDHLVSGGKPTREIVGKAAEFAKSRMASGKSVFAQPGEKFPGIEQKLRSVMEIRQRLADERKAQQQPAPYTSFSDPASQPLTDVAGDMERRTEQGVDTGFVGSMKRGALVTLPQAKQLFSGSAAMAADGLGLPKVRDYFMESYANAEKETERLSRESDSFSSVLDGHGSPGDFMGYWMGYFGGQMAEAGVIMAASAGIGATVGGGIGAAPGAVTGLLLKDGVRAAIKEGAEKILRETTATAIKNGMGREAADAAAKVAMETYAKRATGKALGSTIGFTAGAVGQGVGMETGEIYGELYTEAKKLGRDVTEDEFYRALGYGVAAGAMEGIMDKIAIDRFIGGAAKSGKLSARLAGFTREAAKAELREVPTELIQTGLERMGKGQPLDTPEAQREFVDTFGSVAAGAWLPGVGGLRVAPPAPTKPPERKVDSPLTNAANAAPIVPATTPPAGTGAAPSAGTAAGAQPPINPLAEKNDKLIAEASAEDQRAIEAEQKQWTTSEALSGVSDAKLRDVLDNLTYIEETQGQLTPEQSKVRESIGSEVDRRSKVAAGVTGGEEVQSGLFPESQGKAAPAATAVPGAVSVDDQVRAGVPLDQIEATTTAAKARLRKLQKDAENGTPTTVAPAATAPAVDAPGRKKRSNVVPGSPALAPVDGNVQTAPIGYIPAAVAAPGGGTAAPDGTAAGGRAAVALAAARPWDQANRNRRGDEWFEGARANEAAVAGFTDALSSGGANLQAHGMGKERTLGGGIQNLLNLLTNGLDANRGGGILQTAPLVSRPGEGLVGATASGSAYSDGPFMLVARPGESLTGNLSGLGAVLINQAHADIAPQIAAAIQAIRPDIIVAPYSGAGSVAKQLSSAKVGASTTAPNTSAAKAVTKEPFFRRWFGASKVVDASGNPLVVYHGTLSAPDGGISVFGQKSAGVSWFTSDAKTASDYAQWIKGASNQAVYPVYLSIQNPASISDYHAAIDGITDAESDPEIGLYDPRVIAALKANGFDGMMWTNAEHGGVDGFSGDTYVAFRPEQVKSSTGNRGTFDPANPSISDAPITGESPVAKPVGTTRQASELGKGVKEVADATAPNASVVAQGAPNSANPPAAPAATQDPDRNKDGVSLNDVKAAFMRKVKVPVTRLVGGEEQIVKVSANEAIADLDEEISVYEKLLKCVRSAA